MGGRQLLERGAHCGATARLRGPDLGSDTDHLRVTHRRHLRHGILCARQIALQQPRFGAHRQCLRHRDTIGDGPVQRRLGGNAFLQQQAGARKRHLRRPRSGRGDGSAPSLVMCGVIIAGLQGRRGVAQSYSRIDGRLAAAQQIGQPNHPQGDHGQNGNQARPTPDRASPPDPPLAPHHRIRLRGASVASAMDGLCRAHRAPDGHRMTRRV